MTDTTVDITADDLTADDLAEDAIIVIENPLIPGAPIRRRVDEVTDDGIWTEKADVGGTPRKHTVDEILGDEEVIGVCLPEDEDADDEPEVACDGGRDDSETFDDEDIETAIESNGSEASVDEVRDILASVQRSFEAVWDLHMDAVEDGALELVHEGRNVLVFADHTGTMWGEEFEHGELEDVDIPRGTRRAVVQLHHTEARAHTDYSWSTADPFVVRKPEDFEAGQRFVEAIINSLCDRGLSPGQAWAYYGVEIRGNSRNAWATRMGYTDHSAVSEAVRKAQAKLPR